MAAPPSPPQPHPDPNARRAFARRLAWFLAIVGALWLVFEAAHLAMDFTRPGHEVIYALAEETIREGRLFPEAEPVLRVAAFGDSRMQAGFKPDVFDAATDGLAHSYNLGLPNERRFVEELRILVRRGQTPDVALLTNPWAVEAGPSGIERLQDDRMLMETLFPFRSILRDTVLFALRSVSRGGPLAYARQGRAYAAAAKRDRGYFFIEGMSHYPGHRLPESFRADGDDPDRAQPREFVLEGPVFEELVSLIDASGIRAVYVPSYLRRGSRRDVSLDPELKARLARHGIEVVGPEYWLYPNGHFADPAHLNPDGADVYTRDLAELVRPILREESSRRNLANR